MHDQFNQSEAVVTVVVTVAWYPHQPVQLAATATKGSRIFMLTMVTHVVNLRPRLEQLGYYLRRSDDASIHGSQCIPYRFRQLTG